MEAKKSLREKLEEITASNGGALKLEDPALRTELEGFMRANIALSCREGAALLGIREHQYYTARARMTGRQRKREQRIKFREVKISPPERPYSQEITITTAAGTKIEIFSLEAAVKILGILKC